MTQARHTTFVSVSVTPEAREALRRVTAKLSGKAASRLSTSDALMLVERLLEHVPTVDVREMLDDDRPGRRAVAQHPIAQAVTTPAAPVAEHVPGDTTPVGDVQSWKLGAQQAYNGLTAAQRKRVDSCLSLTDRFHRSEALRAYGNELANRYGLPRMAATRERLNVLADEQHADDPHLNPAHPLRAGRNR